MENEETKNQNTEQNENTQSAESTQGTENTQERTNKKNRMEAFGKTVLEYLDRGVEASKKGLKSAGEAISDFGDKSVIRIELAQLKSRSEKRYRDLGKICYDTLHQEGAVLDASNEEVSACIADIKKIAEDIEKHERALNDGTSAKA